MREQSVRYLRDTLVRLRAGEAIQLGWPASQRRALARDVSVGRSLTYTARPSGTH